MSKETKEVVEGTSTKKVVRRGVASARGTQRLRFSHQDAKNGLFLGHLDNVEVTMVKIGEETTGLPSFNGMQVPRLHFTFASNEAEVAKRKYVPLTFMPAESNVKTIPGGDESWKVDAIFDWIKHILNVYVCKGREFTETEEEMLSLSFTDFDDEGQYVPVDPETVIAAWTALFTNVANMLNNGKDGASYYKTSDNKFIPCWIKLIRYNKTRKKGWTAVSNGELAFPSFVGEGCIEIFKQNTLPSIKLNPINECILPKDIEPKKPQTPNVGIAGMPAAPGIGIPMGDAPAYDPFGGISPDDDLPEAF